MNQPLSQQSHSSSPTHSKDKAKMPVAGLAVLLLAGAGLTAWTGLRVSQAKKSQAVVAEQRAIESQRTLEALKTLRQVQVARGVETTWIPVVEIDGSLVAGQSAELGFKTGGRLSAVHAKLGDHVQAGQVLASLETGEAGAQFQAAQAQVRASEAALALADDAQQRTAPLVQSGVVAEAAGVQTSQQRALSSAQLDGARAQLSLAQVALSNHRLVAPFAGTVTRAPDGFGAVVGPGSVLFQIAELGTLKLQGTVGEQDAALLMPGLVIKLGEESGRAEGTITMVLGTVDPQTRRVRVEATVPNPGGKLRAGVFVRAEVSAGEGIPVLKLPGNVLRPGAQNEVLLVTGNILASRRIAFSFTPSGELLVRHGITAQDQVVVAPKPEDSSGTPVEIGPNAAAAKN